MHLSPYSIHVRIFVPSLTSLHKFGFCMKQVIMDLNEKAHCSQKLLFSFFLFIYIA